MISGQEQKYVYRSLKDRQSWYVPTDLRIGKHLDRLWAVLGLSSAQNQRFTSFFNTAWTLFAQNTAKVYCSSGVPPHVPGWRPQKSSAVREISPRIRMRCRKIVPRPGFLPRNKDGYTINPFCLGIFLRNVTGRHKSGSHWKTIRKTLSCKQDSVLFFLHMCIFFSIFKYWYTVNYAQYSRRNKV